MNKEKSNALMSIIFYVVSILIVVLINYSGKFKSGPCTPNLDILSGLLLVIFNLILLIVNGVLAFVMKKQTKLSFAIHLIALVIYVTYFYFENA
jgi:uncharacterized membrane protein (DUF485 family)